jgi:serine acetyltransferase
MLARMSRGRGRADWSDVSGPGDAWKMQADAHGRREVGQVRRSKGRAWGELRELFGHNSNLSDKVIWCLGLDWQRVKTRFQGYSLPDRIFQTALCWEWWAVVQYRFSYWVHHHAMLIVPGHPILRRLQVIQQIALLRFCYLTGKIVEGLSGARLNPEAEIGPGLVLVHTGSCGIAGRTQIGCNFTMYQDSNVVRGRDDLPATIGDNVTLYSGARVIGPARIGDGVQVGANAVVTRDLPAGCVAVGAPAKPIGDSVSSPSYAASLAVRDLVSTLVLQGRLEEQGEGRYLDRETDEVLVVRCEEG